MSRHIAGHAGGPNAYRENFDTRQVPGMAGGNIGMGGASQQCHFPAPPPFRCYCSPAAFSASNGCSGTSYSSLAAGYGQSRPCSQYS